MPSRRKDFDEIRRLAAMIRRRMTDYDARHRRRFRIDPTTSKLLNLETQNPGIFTIRDRATRLETTVGDLLGEPVIGEADRAKFLEHIRFLIERFDLLSAREALRRQFGVSEEEFLRHEHDFPRVRYALSTTGLLYSIVVRIIGNSMHPVLRDGDEVEIDPDRRSPDRGQVVAIYHRTRGSIIGYWNPGTKGEVSIDKANGAFHSDRLKAGGDWILWGSVTRIVDTPVPPRLSR